MKNKMTLGLRHLALSVFNLEACTKFYTELLGMKIDWHPDADNVYLSNGHDIFALHRAKNAFEKNQPQRLDHFGFVLNTPEAVDEWYTLFKNNHINIKTEPKNHRDGSRSFYCLDPDGNTIQMIYYPPLANK